MHLKNIKSETHETELGILTCHDSLLTFLQDCTYLNYYHIDNFFRLIWKCCTEFHATYAFSLKTSFLREFRKNELFIIIDVRWQTWSFRTWRMSVQRLNHFYSRSIWIWRENEVFIHPLVKGPNWSMSKIRTIPLYKINIKSYFEPHFEWSSASEK